MSVFFPRRGLAAATAILLLCSAASAQTPLQYQDEARELAVLYRGRKPNIYPFRFNGTYYLETRTFSQGQVFYNGKTYSNVLLNLDAYVQDLIVRPGESAGGVVLFRDQVTWFTLGNRLFVNLQYLGVKVAPDGYYELVRDGAEPLLRLSQKRFVTEASPKDSPYYDGNFDAGVVNCFIPQETYYVLEKDRLRKLSARAFRRKLAEKTVTEVSNTLEARLQEWHPSAEEMAYGQLPTASQPVTGLGLPEGFFEEKHSKPVQESDAANALTATYRNKIYSVGEAGKARGGKAVVSGTVFDAESGTPLPGVVVFDEKTATYERTNGHGQYSITLPLGENVLNFNAESKEDLSLKIELLSNGSMDVVMPEKITLLKGAIVSAESMRQHRTTGLGVESVSMKTMGKIPSAFGEGDVIKAVLTLPGVKTVGEASGGFNVRGGSADQNLILFNDNTIYNPSHLFGLFSAFNPDIVDNVELYKSSIPAEFGGRISSVLSVKTKDGDANKVKGSLGIGVLTSRGHIEGPLNKGKTSFILGGRITYSDWLLKLLPKNSAYAGGGAGFGDVNLGLTHHIDSKNSLHLFGYYATDRFSFSGDSTFRYTNINASVAWQHKGDNGSTFRLSVGYDHFQNTLGVHNWAEGAYDLTTVIRQAFLKGKRQRVLGSHTLSYGADIVGYALDPGRMAPFGDASQITDTRLSRETGIEPALYVSDSWQPSEKFSLEGGVRVSSFLAMSPSSAFYVGPEFRLSAKYSPVSNLSFKAGANTMRQHIHLVSNTSSISPMDTWRLSSAEIGPTKGWQAAGGIYWTLLGAGLDLSLEGYYKQSTNALDYKSGALLSMNENLAQDLVPVRGRAYGVEVLLKKPVGKLTGWVSYTYSRSMLQEMLDRGSETINGGAWYNAPYDKPHEFKLVGNWAITHRFSFSVNVDYSTGRPITVPSGKYLYDGVWRLAYTQRNGYRIPDYFRIDAAFNIDPGHYLKALAHASITIGVYNVTGRKNPYSVYFRSQPSGEVKGYMLSVFATQVPYINLNILF